MMEKPRTRLKRTNGSRVSRHLSQIGQCLLGTIGIVVLASAARAETAWPTPNLPSDLTTYAIGEQLTVNGMPMRLRGFVSRQSPSKLVDALRRSMQQPLVENTVGKSQVLGQASGNFYITVQIEPFGSGSKGTVAVSDLASLSAGHREREASNARWLDRLPAGSRIASDMTSQDGGRAVRHVTYSNGHSEALNRDALARLMSDDGYVVEREVGAHDVPPTAAISKLGDARTLYFKAPGKEATAVITRTGEQTSVVLNTRSVLEKFQ